MNIVEFVNISQKCYEKLKNLELEDQQTSDDGTN